MENAIKILNAFADENRIRIFKLLAKKMLTLEQLLNIIEIEKKELLKHLEILQNIQVIKKLDNSDNPQFFAKSSSAIFDKYAKDIINLINKWFNNNETIINDFQKIHNIKFKG